jgi:hypothetical protein
LPTFNANFFKIPAGSRESAALDEFIEHIKENDSVLTRPEDDEVLLKFRDRIKEIVSADAVSDSTMF